MSTGSDATQLALSNIIEWRCKIVLFGVFHLFLHLLLHLVELMDAVVGVVLEVLLMVLLNSDRKEQEPQMEGGYDH